MTSRYSPELVEVENGKWLVHWRLRRQGRRWWWLNPAWIEVHGLPPADDWCPRSVWKWTAGAMPGELIPRDARDLWLRQQGWCGFCWQPMEWPTGRLDLKSRPTVDHIRAQEHGGFDTWTNLQAVHGSCNSRKGARVGLHASWLDVEFPGHYVAAWPKDQVAQWQADLEYERRNPPPSVREKIERAARLQAEWSARCWHEPIPLNPAYEQETPF